MSAEIGMGFRITHESRGPRVWTVWEWWEWGTALASLLLSRFMSVLFFFTFLSFSLPSLSKLTHSLSILSFHSCDAIIYSLNTFHSFLASWFHFVVYHFHFFFQVLEVCPTFLCFLFKPPLCFLAAIIAAFIVNLLPKQKTCLFILSFPLRDSTLTISQPLGKSLPFCFSLSPKRIYLFSILFFPSNYTILNSSFSCLKFCWSRSSHFSCLCVFVSVGNEPKKQELWRHEAAEAEDVFVCGVGDIEMGWGHGRC